jgi:hypothetical protein
MSQLFVVDHFLVAVATTTQMSQLRGVFIVFIHASIIRQSCVWRSLCTDNAWLIFGNKQ